MVFWKWLLLLLITNYHLKVATCFSKRYDAIELEISLNATYYKHMRVKTAT